MQPALRLADSDSSELRIQPDDLLRHLESSSANFEKLLADLHCFPEDLHQTLADPNTAELLKLKIQLASLQLKLLSIRYIPSAFHKLVQLMVESEKPEVARRSATTVLELAGVSTRNASAKPEPVITPRTPSEEEEEFSPHERELLGATCFSLQLMRNHDIDLSKLSEDKLPAIANFLRSFIPQPTSGTATVRERQSPMPAEGMPASGKTPNP